MQRARVARAVRVKLGVFHTVDGAKLQARAARRFFRRHPGAQELVGVLLDVKAHLLRHGVFEMTAAEKGAQDGHQATRHVTPRRERC
jgi:hypothetical protein